MPKKILVKEGALTKFLQSFFIAKGKGKEDQFINKLEKVSPEVAKMWDDLNNSIDSNTVRHYKWLKSKGYDTSAMDDFIKKYNITV
jgi:uncharacterized protein (UPF0335 family)